LCGKSSGLAMIDALPGHGKTWLVLSIAYAVATGKSLLGWECERPVPTLYVDGELPGATLQERIKLLGEVPEKDFRIFSHAQFAARGEMMLDVGTEAGRAALDAEIEAHQIGLIVLDSVTTLVRSGDDNDIASWREVQDWSLKHRARGRAVIFLHHHGRSGNPRGTSAREIVLDSRIKLARDAEISTDAETAFRLEFVKAREFYGEDAEPMIAFLSTQDGVASWRRETVKASNRERVKELHADGWLVKDIAAELKLTPGRVSQIQKELGLKANTPKETDEAV
jgi:putative DNA primase/helicase